MCDCCKRAICARHYPVLKQQMELRRVSLDVLLAGYNFKCPACWDSEQRKDREQRKDVAAKPYIVSVPISPVTKC